MLCVTTLCSFPPTDIKPGQGMLKLPSGKFKAVWCDANNYGAASKKVGQEAAPCTACPNNMVANKPTELTSAIYNDDDNNLATAGDGGFTSPLACVTKKGYGYNGRISYKCPPGWYNEGGNRTACRQCPAGLTTSDDPDKQGSEADCGLDIGFGFYGNAIVPCPIGKLEL